MVLGHILVSQLGRGIPQPLLDVTRMHLILEMKHEIGNRSL